MRSPFKSAPRHRRAGPRRRLLRDLLLLLAVTTGSLLAAVFYAGESLRADLARAQLKELAYKTGEDFSGFFEPAEKGLRMARSWGESGSLDLDDPAALVNRFVPLLDNVEKASALVIGDSSGRAFFLHREGTHWVSRSTRADGSATWNHWTGKGEFVKRVEERSDFDPRRRPWFAGAAGNAATGGVYWTRPYLFFTEKTPGVSGAVRYRAHGLTYVVGLDLPLKRILKAVTDLKVGDRGEAFLVEADGSVLLPHELDTESTGVPVSLSPQRFLAGPVFEAVKAWKGADNRGNTPLRYRSGDAWWAWLQPIGRKEGLWLGIAVPEVDFLGAVQSGWHLVLLVGLLVLGAGLILTLALTRRYGRQFKALPAFTEHPADFERKVLSLIRYGESPTVEFKSTMRTNLKTGKPGKEIELAWLKGVVGFLNTDGGVLLIGVNDDGEVIGIEADAFENDDKCLLHFKNLVNQHIGAEYSRFIHADLRRVSERQILAVSCEKAGEPVFLMVGKNEEFHIRSGPSSMKLTPRQMLQYLS